MHIIVQIGKRLHSYNTDQIVHAEYDPNNWEVLLHMADGNEYTIRGSMGKLFWEQYEKGGVGLSV